ncbi:MAG TPA: SGNH/GDSL hydrolase family protein [Luteolibacter sp.]|nr:SGNH/GDSL hydrolase family protein [Luteolibacter sp.]
MHALLKISSLMCLISTAPVWADKPAQNEPYTPPADTRGPWAIVPDPALPDVLILGDSISIAYTRPVRKLLEGKANVFRPMRPDGRGPDNCGDTTIGLAKIDTWLGGREWELIHFNWGLWDLCYRHPESKEQGKRDKVNGTLSTAPEDYERNLEKLVTRLKATGAKLVWASTTAVPGGEVGRFVGDDAKYNAIAERVMDRHEIPINDLYAVSKAFPADHFVGPGDVHFTGEGSAKLAARVAAEIRGVLKKADN